MRLEARQARVCACMAPRAWVCWEGRRTDGHALSQRERLDSLQRKDGHKRRDVIAVQQHEASAAIPRRRRQLHRVASALRCCGCLCTATPSHTTAAASPAATATAGVVEHDPVCISVERSAERVPCRRRGEPLWPLPPHLHAACASARLGGGMCAAWGCSCASAGKGRYAEATHLHPVAATFVIEAPEGPGGATGGSPGYRWSDLLSSFRLHGAERCHTAGRGRCVDDFHVEAHWLQPMFQSCCWNRSHSICTV